MYARPYLLLCLLLALVGIVVLMWFFSNLVVYFALSLVFTTLLKSLVHTIRQIRIFNRRIPRAVAILFSFLLAATVFWIIFWLFFPLIVEQIKIVSSLDFQSFLMYIAKPIGSIEHFLIDLQVTNSKPGFLSDLIRDGLLTFFSNIEVSSVLNYFVEFTGGTFLLLLSVTFITFILLYEEQALYRSFIALVPNRYFEMVITWTFKIEKRFVSYLTGLSIQIGIIFTLITVGLLIVGVEYAATVALFAAIANLVPYLGPLLGAVFGIIVGVSAAGAELFSYDMLILVTHIGVVFLAVQLVDNLLVQPIVFSRSVKAHPIEIFLIIFVGATIAGILGMVAAIPAYTILKVSVVEGYKGFSGYRIFRAQ